MASAKKAMSEQIYEQLYEEIIYCQYESGRMITEAEISEKFNVSKTPAREALSLLCLDGLMDKIPHKGYIIKSLSFAEIQHLLQFRVILENASVELAIKYASDNEIAQVEKIAHQRLQPGEEDLYNKYNDLNIKFHMAVAHLSKNPYIVSTLQNVLNKLRRALIIDVQGADISELLEAHTTIIQAIKQRDLEKALQCSKEQIEVVERRLFLT